MRKTTTALTSLAVAGALTAFGLAPSALAAAPASDDTASTTASGDHREHRGHHGHGPRDGDRPGLDTISSVLDLTVAELREAREAGLTLAELAEQQGVELELLIDALVADAEERLSERVAAGDLTREQADERLDRIEQRITDRVNGEQPERGEPGPGDRGGPGSRGAADGDES